MSIECKICGKLFSKMITTTHLKQHEITMSEYKSRFGKTSNICSEYSKQLSESTTGKNNPNYNKKWSNEQRRDASDRVSEQFKNGRTAWNKDKKITDPVTLLTIKNAIQKREERYSTGELTRAHNPHTDETKQKLSIAQKKYADENPEEMSRRGKAAIETRASHGYDLAFFKGKKHSTETKEKIKSKSRLFGQIKTLQGIERITEAIQECNFTLLSNPTENKILKLKCNVCEGEFSYHKQMFTPSKIRDNLCPTCYPRSYARISTGETELFDYIKGFSQDAVQSYRASYHEYEIDIYVPSLKIGFEFDGLFWHNDTIVEADRIVKKYKYWEDRGIRIYNIFEDEWEQYRDIVESRIKNILVQTTNKIYARKCTIAEIDSRTASAFCNTNHIMGSGRSNVKLGLFFNNTLVSVMTFSKNNISRKVTDWEISRFCSALNTSVVGGASKLFKYFVDKYDPEKVISYADNRWSDGNLYQTLNFERESVGTQNYWYFLSNDITRIHRYTLRKNKDDDQTLSEYENRLQQGYLRVWDLGSSRWVWKKQKEA